MTVTPAEASFKAVMSMLVMTSIQVQQAPLKNTVNQMATVNMTGREDLKGIMAHRGDHSGDHSGGHSRALNLEEIPPLRMRSRALATHKLHCSRRL